VPLLSCIEGMAFVACVRITLVSKILFLADFFAPIISSSANASSLALCSSSREPLTLTGWTRGLHRRNPFQPWPRLTV